MRAAIYCRVSTDKQEDNTSLATQESTCRAYADDRGFAVAGVWRDTVVGTTIDRPGLDSLLVAGRAGTVDAMIVYKQDRLGRGEAFTVQKWRCKIAGLALHCPLEPLKDGLAGDVEHFARTLVSGEEARNIRLRTQAGRRQRAASGKLLPGARPLYGYRWNEDKSAYSINPLTAPVVKRIVVALATGKSARKIGIDLTAEGIPTPNKGRVWHHSAVRAIGINPRYMGRATGYRHRHEIDPDTGKLRRLADPTEGVAMPDGVIPPLIDAATFRVAGERLAANIKASLRNNQHPEAFLLRGGFARCGACGRAAHTHWQRRKTEGTPKQGRYRVIRNPEQHHDCPNASVAAQELDAAAWRVVERIMLDPEVLFARLVAGEGEDPDTAELADVERALSQVGRRVARLTDRLAEEDDSDVGAALLAKLRTLTGESRALDERRGAARAIVGRIRHLQAGVVGPETLTDAREVQAAMLRRLDAMPYDERREWLRRLGLRALLFPPGHEPRYRITTTHEVRSTADTSP